MDADDVRRAIWRMGHEIVERNHGVESVILVGLQTGGVALAHALADALGEIDGTTPPVGTLDVALYRDDIGIRPVLPEAVTHIPVDLDGAVVVLVDDVLFTGRTIRAALDALELLRPGAVGAARRHGRSRPSGAPDPPRLRRQEPADPTRRDGQRQPVGSRPRRAREGPALMARHLLSIADLPTDDLDQLLRLTDTFVEVSKRPIPKVPALRGKNVVWLFYEDSTRTRLSFEQAAKRLSADTMTFSVGSSSVNKGESLRDTVLTIEAMGVDGIVVRHRSAGVPWQVARWLDDRVAVVNAGDGWHEHPTQALLDCYTIRQHRKSLEGLRIGIVGDVKHSRVARSDVLAFTKLGAEVALVAPPTLLPPSLEGWPVARAPRPRRGARRPRCRLPAADAAGAHDRAPGAVAA